MKCPNCGADSWADSWAGGPEGGGSQNILCTACFSEYCESAFGLKPIKFDAQRIRALYGYDAVDPEPSIRDSIIDKMLEDIIDKMLEDI